MYLKLKIDFERKTNDYAKSLFEKWKEETMKKEIELKLKEIEKKIREDAIKRSSSVIKGKIAEQLAPIYKFDKIGVNPNDARFLGDPVDYIVFNGLSKGKVERITFLEIKSGNAKLNKNEKMIKEVIKNKKIEWKEINI